MNGEKRYEFRKTIFRNRNIERAYIYSTAPIKMVVGTFLIGGIFEDYPEQLWEKFHKFSGLSSKEFFNYFNKEKKGFAIKIESVEEFDIPVNPREGNPDFVPPQSFYYYEVPYREEC
jgi:type I restriction enzyme S subunit